MDSLIRAYQKNEILPRPIFSPLSGGKLNPSKLINEINIQGNIRLNSKYNVLRRICISNITNGYFSGQQS